MNLRPARGPAWALNARSATYALIGAALYGLLGLFVVPLGSLVLRPGFALVPFFGYSFGPLAGFASGFIGQAIVEGIGGVAPADSWAHGLSSGLAGGSIAALVGSAIGGLALFLHNTGGTSFANLAVDTYVPIALGNALVAVVLVPVLVYAWDPLSESIAA